MIIYLMADTTHFHIIIFLVLGGVVGHERPLPHFIVGWGGSILPKTIAIHKLVPTSYDATCIGFNKNHLHQKKNRNQECKWHDI